MERRPRILAILPAFIPSTQICVVRPFLALHRAGKIRARITLESLTFRRDLEWADLAVFCRNTEPDYRHNLDSCMARRVPIIYDIDDNFFDIPEDAEVGAYHKDPGRLRMLRDYLQAASLVRVYSSPMFERVLPLNDRVTKIIPPVDPDLTEKRGMLLGGDRIKIVYATSRGRDDLAAIFLSALHRVLIEYADRVEVHFCGFRPDSLVDTIPGAHWHPLIGDYERYMRWFSGSGFDIGLAPLKDDLFHRSKTNNKFREYGVCGIAGIYSNVDVYSSCVVQGETGLLVTNDEESWYKALVTLIEDRELRKSIAWRGEDFIRRHYSQEAFEQVWWQQIHTILSEAGMKAVSPNRWCSPNLCGDSLNEGWNHPVKPKGRPLAGIKVVGRLFANIAISSGYGIRAVLRQLLFYVFNVAKVCRLRISTSR